MSEVPTPEQNYTPQRRKPQRVLACVLCQQRKVKCNRKFPCANCTRLGATCVPATLTPRRRRRTFPERVLLDRIRKYEDLLSQNDIKFEPLPKDPSAENESPSVVGSNDADEEPSQTAAEEQSYSSTTVKTERTYEAKNFWDAMNQGFRDPGDDSDSSHDGLREDTLRGAWDHLYKNNDNLLLGSRKTTVNLSTLHPDPVQIFRLWQIYLDNVNPLLKVTHTPTLQGRIIEAASNIAGVSAVLEALMFGIYSVSIQSLAVDDCQVIFGSPKEGLLTAYQFGCEQALLNCGFLRTRDLDCLAALFLYLVSLGHTADPRSMSSLLGVAIRIAQRLGIDSESANIKCTVLDAEIRRRVWWSLVFFDSRIGEMAGYKPVTLAPTWDCRIPLNVNDSDLRPEMKEPPMVQGKYAEALFTVVRSEVGEFVRHATFYLDFTTPALKPIAKHGHHGSVLEGSGMARLERMIEDKYLQSCDSDNPLHFITIWTTRAYFAKYSLVEYYSKCSSGQQTEAQRDDALSHAFRWLECDTMIMNSPLAKGYLWLVRYYFPLPAYLHIIQDLKRRLVGEQAERAWEIMSTHYESRYDFIYPGNPLFELFTRMIFQVWEAHEVSLRESGHSPVTPRIVSHFRNSLAQIGPSAQKVDSEQGNAAINVDVNMAGLPMSPPMGFDGRSPLHGMGGQGNYTGMGPDVFNALNPPWQSPLDVDLNQLNWPMY